MEKQIICTKCIMDRSAKEITFDADGICNFCRGAERELAAIEKERPNLEKVVEKIKRAGKGKQYDCLIGLSGGVDSSWALHNAIELGLRPFCYSVDNGWNNPRADENIMKLVEGLKVPFYRYVLDPKPFLTLQMAFIKAGVPNIEIPTDHVLMATAFEMAKLYDIKYIISGGNVATESIMPASWGYSARDLVHIKAIFKWATGKELTGVPTCSLKEWNYHRWIRGVKTVYLLDYLLYNRASAISTLNKLYGYQEYGEKHCENVYTWWFQNYYLFEKFGIDKRKAHLSSLINSGQMTRSEALQELGRNPVYPTLKNLNNKIFEYDKRPHSYFPTDEKTYRLIAGIVKTLHL